MLQRANQIQLVGRAFAHVNHHACAVHLLNRLNLALFFHHQRAFDSDVGRRKAKLIFPRRVDSQKGDIPLILQRRVHYLPGRRPGHKPRFALALCSQFLCQLDGDPPGDPSGSSVVSTGLPRLMAKRKYPF
jgi:hypothetical protein